MRWAQQTMLRLAQQDLIHLVQQVLLHPAQQGLFRQIKQGFHLRFKTNSKGSIICFKQFNRLLLSHVFMFVARHECDKKYEFGHYIIDKKSSFVHHYW